MDYQLRMIKWLRLAFKYAKTREEYTETIKKYILIAKENPKWKLFKKEFEYYLNDYLMIRGLK